MVTDVTRLIDCNHLGNDRVIGAYEVDGLIVDPGPASTVDALLEGLGDTEPRALLLTHIHLDHAGASGVLARRFPELKVYVHELGAPHMADPAKLLKSARQLYGDDMDRLWGEVAPVPEERIVVLEGGETVEGFRVEYAPGHASHHVVYLHEETGEAFTGDVAGVRIPPSDFTAPPTPPPDVDLEAWERSIKLLESWSPAALCLTHFGRVEAVEEHLDRLRFGIARNAELARAHGEEAFVAALEADVRDHTGDDPGVAERFLQAAPSDQLYLGLERYWRKKAEREGAATGEGVAEAAPASRP
jgi:glyoxylase-like metal-dependent hydrolase (beta-lactamase superfamily II)